MTVTMSTADHVLKTAYLDVVAEYLDYKANPFLAKIKKTTDNVYGKEIKKVVRRGINGAFSAGTEDGELPEATGTNFAEFILTLKNLYGTIEISDKAIRASQNKSGAITNILNDEMESLMKSAELNFSRMLFGNQSGVVATVTLMDYNKIYVDTVANIVPGMKIYFVKPDGRIVKEYPVEVLGVNKLENYIDFDMNKVLISDFNIDDKLCIQSGYTNELTGLDSLFNDQITHMYGLNKSDYPNLLAKTYYSVGNITEMKIQKAIDEVEDSYGGKINFIVCSSGVKRALIEHMSTYKRNMDVLDLQGGYKTVSFNGIPVVSDRFCPSGTMYLLNTDDFAIHQLCDWEWLEGEDGKILKQLPNKPVYRATLVKYADLLCSRPWAQVKLTDIVEN